MGPAWRVTALHWAAYGDHVSTVELLVERGADVAADPSGGGTGPLGVASVFYHRPEIARLLIDHGANPQAVPNESFNRHSR